MNETKDFVLDCLYTAQSILTNRKINNGEYLDALSQLRSAIRVIEQDEILWKTGKMMKGRPQ
jgi:hypothetical protein